MMPSMVQALTKYTDLVTCSQCMLQQQYWPWLSYCTLQSSPYYMSCTDANCGQAITDLVHCNQV